MKNCNSAISKLLLASVVTASGLSAQVKDFVIPHFAIGDGWSSRLTLLYTPWFAARSCQAVFKDPNGVTVKVVPLSQATPDPSLYLETLDGGKLQTGHVEFDCDNPFFEKLFGLQAYVIFTYRKDGIQYEASASVDSVAETKRLIIDGSDGHSHGLAVYNHSRFPALIGFTLKDVKGNTIKTGTLNLGAYQQTSFTLETKYPDLMNAIGVLTFSDTATTQKATISVVGFRFSPQGQFTNIPVG